MVGRRFQTPLAAGMWAAACWPVWGWYGMRLGCLPEQGWLALAPVTAFFLAIRKRPWVDAPAPLIRWIPAIVLMAAYALGYPFLPMTLRALLAVAALLFIPGPWRRGFWPAPAVAGLCVIGLPAVAMLQFYFGYPLRVLVSALAAPLLRLTGFDVVRNGVMLIWQGETIGVDVPCSGIRMGWMGLYLGLAAAGLTELGWWRTLALLAAAGLLVVAANTFRVAGLFVVQALGFGDRPTLHAGIGVMLFLLVAIGIAGCVRLLTRRTR